MEAPMTPDQAQARATVAAMTALVDRRDWERLEDLFSDSLTLDYTSLWGGEPQEVTQGALLDQWRAMLPGFDATCHELGPVTVTVAGDGAEAEAPISGTHLLGEEAWVVEGRYRVALRREGGAWRITALAYLNETEAGDRALTERAKARVARADA